jgi:hypothetical protein
VNDERIDRLARRVRWLEDKRRAIRIAIGVTLAVLGFVFLPDILGGDWPRFHARLTAIAFACAITFIVDIGLATAISMWEAKHDRLVRDRGLPRAVLRK